MNLLRQKNFGQGLSIKDLDFLELDLMVRYQLFSTYIHFQDSLEIFRNVFNPEFKYSNGIDCLVHFCKKKKLLEKLEFCRELLNINSIANSA